jgi:hypothetical protein
VTWEGYQFLQSTGALVPGAAYFCTDAPGAGGASIEELAYEEYQSRAQAGALDPGTLYCVTGAPDGAF